MDRRLRGEKDFVTLKNIARDQSPYLRSIDPINDWSGYESLTSDQASSLFAQFCKKHNREGDGALPRTTRFFFGRNGKPPFAEICTASNEWFLVSTKEVVSITFIRA